MDLQARSRGVTDFGTATHMAPVGMRGLQGTKSQGRMRVVIIRGGLNGFLAIHRRMCFTRPRALH